MDYFGGRQVVEKKAEQAQGPLSPKGLYELFLFSTTTFMAAALLVQLLISLQLSLMLNFLSIEYVYHPLGVGYTFASELKWNDARVFGVYGIAPLVFFAIGVGLARFLFKNQTINWKWRLFLTWFAFLLVHTLPVGLIAGVVLYDGYGYAFRWLVDSIGIRAVLAVALIALIRYYRLFWLSGFLKSAYSLSLIGEFATRKAFLVNAVYRPWLIGCLALMPFVAGVQSIYWGSFLVLLGIVLVPLWQDDFPDTKLKIHVSTQKIWPMQYPVVYMAALWALLWVSMWLFF